MILVLSSGIEIYSFAGFNSLSTVFALMEGYNSLIFLQRRIYYFVIVLKPLDAIIFKAILSVT